MRQYKLVNNITGWFTFVVAAIVYCLTIEPTASFWDCPEFITTGYKLEVGHPPGAPFFMLTANLFSQFVSDPSQVARMVNTMSALLSAGCILFLFWTITHLTRSLICPDVEKMTLGQLITIMGAGIVGALAYTFSDTFWFSAVEGEVYAYSSLFTAAVFWLILKWEDVADEPHSDRWLILIAYLTGLSIGVHLLNLLCIPAIVLVYYYKKNPNANLKGSLLALVGSMILIAVVLYGIVPGAVKVGGWFELLFVNVLGMPFNTGVIVYIVLLAACLIWGVYESYTVKSVKRMNIAFVATVSMLGIPFYGYGALSIIGGIVVLALLVMWLFGVFSKKVMVSARALNTALLCLMMIMVGYSSYALIVIRSTANTPMDQNSPEDIFTLGDYLGREQYGTRPLFYGQAYSSKVKLKQEGGYCVPVSVEGAPVYQRKEKVTPDEKDSYEVVRHKTDYVYAQNMLFPRMYSEQHANWAGHNLYEEWLGGVKGYQVPYDECGQTVMVKMPTQWDNIRFFLSYQVNYMYWRYFMWNFAGRQNDIQGSGENDKGNWITGISFIDNLMLGDQSLLPDDLKNNKGHNVFYCLPLLLGLIGLFWQAYKGEKGIKQFWVVFFLFFMTGLAIVLYLNQTPNQPRERDYAYAGSFYAFAIWIGLGVVGVARLINKYLGKGTKPAETYDDNGQISRFADKTGKRTDICVTAAVIASVLCLCIPIQMASQTWDDHDRSGRYTCRDFGQNYLMSLQQEGKPIIYTNGDNDTFPLWYNQETENFRTDVRVCNLSYLQTDWYIDQMRRPAYESPSVPIQWNRIEYVSGTNEYVPIRPEAKSQVLEIYKSNPEAAKESFGDDPFELKNILKYWVRTKNADLHFIPTDTVYITIDKDAVRRSGMIIPKELNDSIPDKMIIPLKKRALYKSDLMMLEMLANANWERPIYIATTVGEENHMGLSPFFVQEGLAYRITPFNMQQLGYPQNMREGYYIDTEKMYDNLMNKFKFGGIENPKVYLDETITRMCYTHRRMFSQLVTQLLKEGKNDKALKALDYCEKVIPNATLPHDYQSGSMTLANAYFQLGKKEQAEAIVEVLGKKSAEHAAWVMSLDETHFQQNFDECQYHISLLNEVARVLVENDPDAEVTKTYAEKFNKLYDMLKLRLGSK